MSRNLINLALLLFVLGLASLVIWEPGQQQDESNRLSSLQADDIDRIRIQHDGLQDIQLQRRNDHWYMLAPYSVVADETRVNALLKLPAATSYTRFAAEGRPLDNYGLAPVLAQVKLNDSLFQFGGLEDINRRRYVLSPDNDIHLITDLFYHQLRTSAPSFVSPRLFSDTQRITRLMLADRQYEKQHDGTWLLTATTNDNPPADMLNAYIENWQRLRASRVSAAGTQRSDEHVRIVLADDSNLVFEILRSEDEVVFIRRDLGLQYHLSLQAAEALFALPNAEALK